MEKIKKIQYKVNHNQVNNMTGNFKKMGLKTKKKKNKNTKISFKKFSNGLSKRQPTKYKVGNYMKMANRINSSYERAILFPEQVRDARIPGMFPLPTISYHKRISYVVPTNDYGRLSWLINPWYLADTGNTGSMIYTNNDPTNDLITAGNAKYQCAPNGYNITIGSVSTYRLVSASLVVTPQVSFNTAQGSLCGGIVTMAGTSESVATASYPIGTGTINPAGISNNVISNVEASLFYQRANIGIESQLRHIYVPFDPSFNQFIALGKSRGDLFNSFQDEFYWIGYANGAAADTPIQFEITFNFELEPNENSFLESLASSTIMRSKPEDTIQKIAVCDEAISQSGPNVFQEVQKADTNFIETGKLSIFDKTVSYVSDHAADLLKLSSVFF